MVNVCPKLTCSEPLGDKLCFMHSASNPVEWIKLMKCPQGYLCDSTQKLGWFDTKAQSILGSTSPYKSPVWRKQTIAKCEKYEAFGYNLLPGRTCYSDSQCLSFNCNDRKCKGYSSGTSCSSHE